jgi:hypothetical protein
MDSGGQCYQSERKVQNSIVASNELLDTERAIQEGKEHTPVSSTLWRMVQKK